MMLTKMTYQQKMTKSKRILKDYRFICTQYKSWQKEVQDAQEMLRFLMNSKEEWFEMRQLKSTQYNRTIFEPNTRFSKVEGVQQQYITMIQAQKETINVLCSHAQQVTPFLQYMQSAIDSLPKNEKMLMKKYYTENISMAQINQESNVLNSFDRVTLWQMEQKARNMLFPMLFNELCLRLWSNATYIFNGTEN